MAMFQDKLFLYQCFLTILHLNDHHHCLYVMSFRSSSYFHSRHRHHRLRRKHQVQRLYRVHRLSCRWVKSSLQMRPIQLLLFQLCKWFAVMEWAWFYINVSICIDHVYFCKLIAVFKWVRVKCDCAWIS